MKVITYTRPADGGVTVVVPAPNDRREGETEDDQAARVAQKDVPSALRGHVRDIAELPDHAFRDAWEENAERVQVNMPKARQIKMQRIRAARDRKLRGTDGPMLRAIEKGATDPEALELGKKRQRLRDLPQNVDLQPIRTPEALADFWPDELKE